MTKFPRQLMSDMWDSNVRFDKILHIPTLSASMSDRISDEFQGFLGDAYEDYQNAALLEQCPALASTLKESRTTIVLKNIRVILRGIYTGNAAILNF